MPTDAELAILRVLWERGPSTVRQVQETLERDRPTGYTTALKMLQIMTEKGLVQRNATELGLKLNSLRHAFNWRFGVTLGIEPRSYQILTREIVARLTINARI